MSSVNQSRYQSLFNSNIVGIMIADIHGHIHDANDIFLQMVGHERSDLPLRWDEMTPPEWRAQDDIHVQELVKTGVGSPWEKEYFRKDGSRVPVRVAVAMASQEQGVCIVQDLTERKATELALRHSDEQFRSMFENIPLMYFKMDREGTVQAVNTHGAAELGYDADELIGRPVLDVFHPDDRDTVAHQFETLVSAAGTIARWEFRKIRKDGSMLWVRELARAVLQPDGEVAVLVACHDITAEKAADQALGHYRDQLKMLSAKLARAEEAERSRIARDLHDQIGQALAMVKIRLGALATVEAPEERQTEIDEIRSSVDGAIAATRSLTFELSSPVLHELGLAPALKSLCEASQGASGIRFDFDSRSETEIDNGSRMTVYRVVRELIVNAIKHARCTIVAVTIHDDPEGLHIAVKDDGVGFDPRAMVSEPTDLTGGFGLFNAREQLEQLGGHLLIDATPGSGTSATVTVPTSPLP